mmetsp:Transcript_9904/g.28482  ORF Transcript_9904/g.28482 Transcript_9904/m.28482 type:complete len:426 (+) Transcript_9904:870-2147(+)
MLGAVGAGGGARLPRGAEPGRGAQLQGPRGGVPDVARGRAAAQDHEPREDARGVRQARVFAAGLGVRGGAAAPGHVDGAAHLHRAPVPGGARRAQSFGGRPHHHGHARDHRRRCQVARDAQPREQREAPRHRDPRAEVRLAPHHGGRDQAVPLLHRRQPQLPHRPPRPRRQDGAIPHHTLPAGPGGTRVRPVHLRRRGRRAALAQPREAVLLRAAVAHPLARDRARHVPPLVPERGGPAGPGQPLRAPRHGPGPAARAAGAEDLQGHAQHPARDPGEGGALDRVERGASGRQQRAQRAALHRQVHPDLVHPQPHRGRPQAATRAVQGPHHRDLHPRRVRRARPTAQGHPGGLLPLRLRRQRRRQLLRRGVLHRRPADVGVELVQPDRVQTLLPRVPPRGLLLLRRRVPALSGGGGGVVAVAASST